MKHHLANARSRVEVATTARLVWILAPRLPGPAICGAQADGRVWSNPPAAQEVIANPTSAADCPLPRNIA